MNGLERGISRRRFLQGMSGTVGGLGLAACEYQPAPSQPPPEVRATVAPAPTRRPYVMPVEVKLMIGPISDRNSEALPRVNESFSQLLSWHSDQSRVSKAEERVIGNGSKSCLSLGMELT